MRPPPAKLTFRCKRNERLVLAFHPLLAPIVMGQLVSLSSLHTLANQPLYNYLSISQGWQRACNLHHDGNRTARVLHTVPDARLIG